MNSTTANLGLGTRIVFSWFDFVLFGGMLGLSVLIGIYFGCFGSKQNSTKEYLLGGKNMNVFPIAMSLIASHVSGISLLAVPADVYMYGANYIWVTGALVVVCTTTSYVFLPVFYKLQLTSTYEYLKLRFHHKVRTLASFLFALNIFLYLPVVVYIPALAFSQATDISVHLIAPFVCIVCIFYTTIGGLKAVVWTDTLQFSVTVSALIGVFYMGIQATGGLSNIFEKSVQGERLDILNFDLDPTVRDGFWSAFIGQIFCLFTIISINQSCIQKFMALPNLKDAHRSMIIFGIGLAIVKVINVVTGLIMYTKYADCDPFTKKIVSKTDQLLPYYVMDVAGSIPGLPGLFIAGVFSAGLSTLSSHLNTVSCVIYKDFITPFMPKDTSEERASNILKLIVIICGTIGTLSVFIIERMGGILPFVIKFSGLITGPLFGLFILGMLFPKVTTKGALYGGIGGLVFTIWILIGNLWYTSQGLIHHDPKPLSIEACPISNFNSTIEMVTKATPLCPEFQPFILFRISFYYFSLIGTASTVIIGLIITYIANEDLPPVHPDLISPVIHFLLPKSTPKEKGEYYSVEKALAIVSSSDKNENNYVP